MRRGTAIQGGTGSVGGSSGSRKALTMKSPNRKAFGARTQRGALRRNATLTSAFRSGPLFDCAVPGGKRLRASVSTKIR